MISADRPNVLVVFTDQQRWDCAGLHGNPLDLMPNFDGLARAGTHLRHSFTCQPLCVPARSAMQTGCYPSRSGSYNNDRHLPPHTRTLAHEFRDAGYETAYLGKWHLAPRENPRTVPVEFRGGYEFWLAANVLELVSDAYDTRLYDGEGNEHRPPGYRVDALTDAALRYLEAPRDRPFFLFLSYLEPHHQNHRDDYPAPDGYAARYANRWLPPDLAALGGSAREHLAGYCGMVKRIDENLGRIRDALATSGQLDRTILLFTSDHGCHFKTRNGEYKRSPHESSIRVPTLLHGPGFMGSGDREELVSLIDLPPTLLEAAGIEVPRRMQGRSLLRRLQQPDSAWPDEIYLELSEAQSGRALRTRRWKYSVAVRGAEAAAALGQPHWPIYFEDELFDLERDPHELVNLAGHARYAPIAAELRGRLLRRMREIGHPPAEIVPACAPSGADAPRPVPAVD